MVGYGSTGRAQCRGRIEDFDGDRCRPCEGEGRTGFVRNSFCGLTSPRSHRFRSADTWLPLKAIARLAADTGSATCPFGLTAFAYDCHTVETWRSHEWFIDMPPIPPVAEARTGVRSNAYPQNAGPGRRPARPPLGRTAVVPEPGRAGSAPNATGGSFAPKRAGYRSSTQIGQG